MNKASYITHVELENPNLAPEIRIYMYATTKHTSGSGTTTLQDNFTDDYAGWYNTSPITLWNTTAKRFDITPFAVNVGSINYRTQDEFMSSDKLSSSTSLVLLKKIEDFYTLNTQQKGFHFDVVQPQDEEFNYSNGGRINAFNIAGYTKDGLYADIEIKLIIRDQAGTDLGSTAGGTTLFRGLVNSVTNGRNEVTIELLDGLIEARRKGNRIGETIRSEISSYKERFYGANTDYQYGTDEVFDMSAVVDNRTYNLKHFPVIPPIRDSQEKVVKLKIQRENPADWFKRDKVSTPHHEVYESPNFDPSEIYTNYDFTDGEQVEKILKDESLNWKKFEVDWSSGVLKFELPPIVDPEGSLFIEEYKTAYKYKHPAFLAEELFKELGYENVSFSRDNLSPYFPAEGEPLLYEWKIPSKRGVVNRNRDGRNFGATAIHFCEHDNLYYYYSDGGIYKTDFETLNEKICSTHIRERYLDKGSTPNNESTWKWKLVSDSTKGDDIKKLDVNQITVIKPNGKNTALRIIASVNREIEFEEDNPYDIPYPRSRVFVGSQSTKGSIAKDVSRTDTVYYPDRDKFFDWNYDDVNGYDDFPGSSIFTGNNQEGTNATDKTLTWKKGKQTHNWDTSSFNRWRKDTIYTLYYFDIENYADDYYYYFNGSIYERTNAGVVTKKFDIAHDVDKITFLSSYSYENSNAETVTTSNVLQIDYTTVSISPYKKRVHYDLSGVQLAQSFKSSTSGSIIFPQNSEPTKLHNLDFDNATEDSSGYSMLPVDPLYETASPHVYGKSTSEQTDVVSDNPKYYLRQTLGGLENNVNYIGWQEKTYAGDDLFYINKHSLLYGDKLNNNFVIIEDEDNSKQILVALEIGHDESITGMWQSKSNQRHGYNTNMPIGASKDYKKFYEKAIYLCFYDISGTTLTESNKQRIGMDDPSDEDRYRYDYIGFALQRFSPETRIKDSFIGADILYEKEEGMHLIYVLLNDVIMRFRWQPDHSVIHIHNDVPSANQSEVKNALSISRHKTGVRLHNYEDWIRFGDWRTDNLFYRITDYNRFTAMTNKKSTGEANDHVQKDNRSVNFINSRYNSGKYISPTALRKSTDHWGDTQEKFGAGNGKLFYGKIQKMFRKNLWVGNTLKDLKVYESSSSVGTTGGIEKVYLRRQAEDDDAPPEYKKELGYFPDLGCRSYQYIARGHMDNHAYRISQIYGLTKMKGKKVFSVYTVNREYFSKTTPRRTRYDLEEKKQKFRNPDDRLFESNMEGMMAYQYTIDFDEVTYEGDSAPNLRLSSEIFPTAIHQEYYDILNELTSELQLARELTGGDTGKVDSNLNHVLKLIPQNSLKGEVDQFEEVLNSGSRGEYNWSGDLYMGITYTGKGNLLMHDNAKTGQEYSRILTPYKSKYWAYSVAIDKHRHAKTSPSHSGNRTQWFFRKGVQRGAINSGQMERSANIEGRLSCSYLTFLGDSNMGLNYYSYLNSVRREYASNNILPSLLPKTSTHVGSELVHLIGNFGKYFSSDKLSGLAKVWESPHPNLRDNLKNVLQWNTQDTHGTVSITPGNYDYPPKYQRGGSRRFLSKNLGIMFKNSEQEVYKDFACKPIIVSTDEKEDIHFVAGSSIGAEKVMKETILGGSSSSPNLGYNSQYGHKVLQNKEISEPLKSRKLYDNENFMWITLSHEIIPSIPLGNFSNTTIYDGLKQLAMVMDYEYGIEDNAPYFRPKDDYFYHEYVFAPYVDFDYVDYFPTGKELDAFYYMSGEVIYVKSNASQSINGTAVDGKMEVARKINSSTVYPKELKHQKTNLTTYNAGTVDERVSQIGLKPLYKIKMVVDEKNIIDITKLNPPYDSNFTDIHLNYGEHVYKRKIKESSQATKKIYSQSIPLIDNLDWVKFIGRKIQKEISYDRTRLELTTKINPSLRGTDYIAVFFRNSEIKIGTIDNDDTVSNVNVGNVYELYKIKSVNHNLDNFTSSIVADSVETSSIDLVKGGKIT